MVWREYLSDWARNYVAQGKTQGKIESVLAVLSARGIGVPAYIHAEIVDCRDPERLDAWIAVAATAESDRELVKFSG